MSYKERFWSMQVFLFHHIHRKLVKPPPGLLRRSHVDRLAGLIHSPLLSHKVCQQIFKNNLPDRNKNFEENKGKD